MKKYKNFTENEIVNPYFDGCPATKWGQLQKKTQKNLENTLDIVQHIRNIFDYSYRITSTYRPKSRGSAHQKGKAIDFQLIGKEKNNKAHKNIMNFFEAEKSKFSNVRIFLEFQGKGMWFHIDLNFKKSKEAKLYIARPIKNKMKYEKYKGKTPLEF